jgi:hypothetical protein
MRFLSMKTSFSIIGFRDFSYVSGQFIHSDATEEEVARTKHMCGCSLCPPPSFKLSGQAISFASEKSILVQAKAVNSSMIRKRDHFHEGAAGDRQRQELNGGMNDYE